MRSLVLAAFLVLAACSPPGAPGNAQNNQQSAAPATPATQAASNSTKPAGQAVQTTPVAVITREFLIGRWGDNGDCSKDVVLNGDGSFTSYTGGEGAWSLNGATLRMAGKQSTFDLQLAWIDQNTIQVTNPDGSVGHSQRCGDD